MQHNYTDEEIRTAWKDSLSLRAFLDALPTRSAEPERQQPWPGQQEAIDQAFEEVRAAHLVTPKTGDDYAPARLAIAQAYDAARPQSAEIAKLKAALAESEKQFQAKVGEVAKLLGQIGHLEERDRQGREELVQLRTELREARKSEDHWHSEAELLRAEEAKAHAELAAMRESLESKDRVHKQDTKHLESRLYKAEAELAALRQSTQLAQPILADDGRSLGQVAHEASKKYDEEIYGSGGWKEWSEIKCQDLYEAAAQAVVAAARPAIEAECLAQAVRRMEAVPVRELWDIYRHDGSSFATDSMGAVRARLIAAVKGEGQAKEIPQAQPEPAQLWTPSVGDVVRLKSGGPVMTVTDVDPLSLMCAWMNADNELQVEPITTLCLTPVPAP